MLAVKLLGQFDVRRDGTALVIPSRPAQSLFAFLLLNAGVAHRREKLAGLLWPNTPEDNARRNLRQELWRLRKALEPSPTDGAVAYLQSDDISITLDADSAYWLDAAVLERASGERVDDLGSALALYHGELLPGFYDEWVVLERERLRAVYEEKMVRLLNSMQQERRWAEVREWSERWIALGQSPEPAYRALMVAHAESGDMSQVAAVYQRCVEALREDLGVEPSEQTRALFEQLKTGTPGRMVGLVPLLPGSPAPLLDERPAPGEPPYKGLRYFDPADSDLFFGRERLTAALAGRLRERHLLAVVGASGSGKSSLVRAGLIPALKGGKRLADGMLPPEGSSQWTIHVFTPTAHPLEALALALTRDAESATATTTLMDDMARDARGLRIHSHKTMPRNSEEEGRLLLVIDQFEELFTLCRDEAERKAFVDNLLVATAPELDRPVRVVLALRADFYAHCAQYANLRDALSERQEYIGAMSADELRRAIEGPAQRGEWTLEAGLVDLILRDVGTEPGALPLLSHALLETWQRRRARTLTFAGYTASGGVRGAIAKTAESVYQRLPAEQQAIARNIFLRLTELGEGTQDTRRRAAASELVTGTDAAAVGDVLQKLADARLITLGEDSAEVAHEALIREWQRLRDWLTQNREGLRLHRRLTEAAHGWSQANRDEGELYRGARLAQTLEWAKSSVGELNPLEREFVEASEQWQAREEVGREAQRQRELDAAQKLAEVETRRAELERSRAEEQARATHKLRQRAVLLASALLVAALLAIAALAFARQSNQSAEQAESERRIAFARELSVNAVNNLDIDPERSILLALQAVSVSSAGGKPVLREAEEALHRAVQASRVQLTLRGHTAALNGIAYSPDGKRLATASQDKTAKVWDVATGKELLTLCCHDLDVRDVAFSPDGKRLATASSDKTAKIWDAFTGEELFTLRGHTDYIRGIAFSPDGSRVATASLDKTAKIWDATTGKELLTLVGHMGGVRSIAFSPDGTRLATGSFSDEPEHTARVWDAVGGKLLLTLRGHTASVNDIAFSPDGKRLATCSEDGMAKIWDSVSGQLLMDVFVHSNVQDVEFSPDPEGTRLATGSNDGTAKVWDAATGELLQTLAGHTSNVQAVAFNPDGTRLATASNDGTAKVWDITTGGSREWLTLGHNRPVKDIAYSPDGSGLATASNDKTAKIWDALTGKLMLTLSGHTSDIPGVTFSPDGSRVATVSIDQTAKIWDAATGKQLLSISTTIYPFNFGLHTTFSPDGQRIATPGAGNTAKVWDTVTGKELLTLCCHTSYVRGIAFSPDGTRLATGGADRMAKVWDAATGKELLTLSGHTSTVWAVTFSRDGRRIATASGDGTAKVWDAVTGEVLLTLSGYTGNVTDVAFSPDGMRLAAAASDGMLKIWDVSPTTKGNEQPLALYNPTGAGIGGIAISPDGKRVAASSDDGTVRIYALPLEDIVAIAKSRVTRTLTTDECQKFLHVDQCP